MPTSLRIVTANLNGIRSAASKGFFEWLAKQRAHVVCTQELKAQEADLQPGFIRPPGTTLLGHFHYAQKKGYSGVGLHTRLQPERLIVGFGDTEFDAEGRYLEGQFTVGATRLSVISLYLPSGSSGEDRQQAKFRFLERFLPHLEALARAGREVVLCGDWNIAHKEIDLKNWRSNQKNSGFLPEERAWLSRVFKDIGYVDVFRTLDARPDQYTWWSQRGNARANNVGWRIDYQIATPGIAAKAKKASIYIDEIFSDHAPLTVDYAI